MQERLALCVEGLLIETERVGESQSGAEHLTTWKKARSRDSVVLTIFADKIAWKLVAQELLISNIQIKYTAHMFEFFAIENFRAENQRWFWKECTMRSEKGNWHFTVSHVQWSCSIAASSNRDASWCQQ